MVFKQWYYLNFASNAMMMPGKDEFFFAGDVREFESHPSARPQPLYGPAVPK
jgi:hypothetical protein